MVVKVLMSIRLPIIYMNYMLAVPNVLLQLLVQLIITMYKLMKSIFRQYGSEFRNRDVS